MNSSPEIEQSRLLSTRIPIKIQCGCGQKYAFEVEPSGGRMDYTIQCPVCGIDGTALANQVIAQHLAARDAAAPKLRISEPEPPPRVPMLPSRNPARAAQPGTSFAAKAANKWLKAATGAVTFAVILAGIILWFGHAGKSQSLESIGVSDGLPRTPKEINGSYIEPAPGQNAAEFYLQGFDALRIANVGSSDIPLLGKGTLPPLSALISGSMKSALTALIRSNLGALKFFEQGAAFEQSRYPVDLSKGVETPFPHLLKAKKAVQLVELAALLHAESRDGKEAAKDVLTALAMARSLAAEPALISQSVRALMVHAAVGAWEQAVNRTSLPRESLSDLQKAFEKMEDYESRGEGFSRGLAAERVGWISLLGTPQTFQELVLAGVAMDIPAEQRNRLIDRLQEGGSFKEEQQFFDKTFQQLMAARKEAFPERLKTEGVIDQRVREAVQKKLVIMQVLLPGFAGSTAREAGCLADFRLAKTSVALEQFRAANGNRYPTALSELAPQYLPATPTDPFDGQPLRYATKGLGYVLYSIGSDPKNDSTQRVNRKDGHIVFAVVTPPKTDQNLQVRNAE